jgi:hypothetical protein
MVVFNPEAGDHVKLPLDPDATRVTLDPAQIVIDEGKMLVGHGCDQANDKEKKYNKMLFIINNRFKLFILI